ncbi:MAG: hypothetical protein KatS3mg061_0726 [Dehalococcoidia bacterium]|nr:MAG: hypothetical protein KatS3mg061_0726 [Dehalococcoidia bacterium]
MSPLGWFHTLAGLLLLALGLLTLPARKSRFSAHPRFGERYFWLLLLTTSSGLLVGLNHPRLSFFELVTPPTLLAGLVGYVLAKRRPRGWLRWHIIAQSSSYIGVVTAFGSRSSRAYFRLIPSLRWGTGFFQPSLGVC